MRNDGNPVMGNFEEIGNLIRGETRNRDDAVRTFGSVACLLGEAVAEFRSRVVGREHEKIVERADRPPETDRWKALIEAMKEIRGGGTPAIEQQAAANISGRGQAEGTCEPVWPETVEKAGGRLQAGKAGEDLPRIDTDAGKIPSDRVRRIEGNG